LNRRDEAAKVMAAFQKLGPAETRRRPYGGLFDFLNLPPEEQFNRYLTNLQSVINTHPDDPTLKVRLGRALLYAGKTSEALEAFRAARLATSDPSLLASMGRSLLDYEQFTPAREFLEPAVAASPSAAGARLDLAIAVFHSDGPEKGLEVLDETPAAQRQGDYFLLRAQILDALEKPEGAAEALNRGVGAAPTRPDLYFQAALFLIKHKRYQEAIRLLDQASQALPDSPELPLTEAIAYALLRQHDDAVRLLTQIEARWPEWALPYTIHGIMLVIRSRPQQAQPLLETAISLGADDGITYYYLALAMVSGSPEKAAEAQSAVTQALQLNPEDVYTQALAGRISYLQKDYPAALEHLNLAIRAWPDMIEAHENLAAVYRALGDREKSAEHLQAVVRIKQQHPGVDQTPPFLTDRLLFTVRPLAPPAM
jgi:tetratricopeptide (TPR) repeat protein